MRRGPDGAPDDGFEQFALARWPDLEAVAVAATLDLVGARAVTSRTLGQLRRRWRTATEDGRPTVEAQRVLLAELGRWGRGRAGPRESAPTEVDPALRTAADAAGPGPLALLETLADEPPLVRAALAATRSWRTPVEQVTALAGRAGAGLVHATTSARGRLATAHAAAREAEGLPPDPEGVDDDLDLLLARMAQTSPPAPGADELAALATTARRRVRRRAVLAGGAALAGAGALGWLTWGRPTPSPGPHASPTALPAPDDPTWLALSRWPPRGSLASDPVVLSAIEDRAPADTRLLYAGEDHDVRIVVGTRRPDDTGADLWVLSGGSGTDIELLSQLQVSPPWLFGSTTAVAVAVPRGDDCVILAMAPRASSSASFSTHVRPTPQGSVERDATTIALTDGVGSALVGGHPGIATRIACGDYDGPLPRPADWGPDYDEDPEVRAARIVADLTGTPVSRLGTRRIRFPVGPVPGTPYRVGDAPLTADIVTVTTPDGAVVRTAHVAVERGGVEDVVDGRPMVVVASADAEAPVVLRIDDWSRDEGTYLVLVPGDAATVQLMDAAPGGAPASVRVPLNGHSAVVTAPPVDTEPAYRVRLRDGRGHTVYDQVPPAGEDVFDLGDGFS